MNAIRDARPGDSTAPTQRPRVARFTIGRLMLAVAASAGALALARLIGHVYALYLAWTVGVGWGTNSACVRHPEWILRIYFGSAIGAPVAGLLALPAGPVTALATAVVALFVLYPATLGCSVAVMTDLSGRGEDQSPEFVMLFLPYFTFIPLVLIVPGHVLLLAWSRS